ncbi:MAG TPA: hypothetical protein DEB24_04575 [Coriobacteriia bacterium]|nr:hypothetical protein [Coriobacteriia bacterium]
MKKKLIILATVFALVMSMGLLAACAGGTSTTTTTATTVERDGLPNNLPNADHLNYIELQTKTGKECQTCHMATDDKGTPTQKDAGIMPADHYVDGSYASKQFDPQRIQCGSCHAGPATTK